MNRSEILPRVDGREIPTSFHLGRCEPERYARQADGGWAPVRGCDLAFFFRLPAGKHNHDVSCPGCGLSLDITTRRLRAGFLPLSPADVAVLLNSHHRAAEVSCLSPIVSAPVVEALAPRDVRRESLRQKAEAALAAFDAKPVCEVCWRYNASAKRSPRCNDCRDEPRYAYGVEGDRDSYTYKRSEIVERVERYGGTVTPAPVGQAAYAGHIAERKRKAAEYKAQRIAELRARGVRV